MSISTLAGYRCFSFNWQDREIKVHWQNNWLNTSHCHIELRCDERLPVTETGYRSRFVSAVFADEEDVQAFVVMWLNEAAEAPVWVQHVLDSRQLKLF